MSPQNGLWIRLATTRCLTRSTTSGVMPMSSARCTRSRVTALRARRSACWLLILATVAVGLGEALKRNKRRRVDYRAFEFNPMMRKLGKQILRHLGADFRSTEYIKSLKKLKKLDYADVDRLLFTFIYVSHQETVKPPHTRSWASVIKRAVDEVDRAVELIYTTVDLIGGALLGLEKMLKKTNVLKKQHTIDVQVRRRFPGPTGGDGPIGWDEHTRLWDVRAEHWILRT